MRITVKVEFVGAYLADTTPSLPPQAKQTMHVIIVFAIAKPFV